MLACFALWLSGCVSTTPKTVQPSLDLEAYDIDFAHTLPPAEQAMALIQQADVAQLKGQTEQANVMRLQAVRLLLEEGLLTTAASTLQKISPIPTEPTLRGQYIYSKARLALLLGDSVECLAILNSPRLNLASILSELPLALQVEIGLVRAEAHESQQHYTLAIQERVFLTPLLADDLQANNQMRIWQDLQYTPADQLKQQLSRQQGEDLIGWYDLAYLSKSIDTPLDQQVQAIQAWQLRYPNHPVYEHLPEFMKALNKAARKAPQSIALLLPESGPLASAASAIRNGLLSAYYANVEYRPSLNFYDTTTTTDITALYQGAVDNGAELVIGPLSKDLVVQLAQLDTLPVPVLALNYTNQDELNDNLFQFGLSPEQEARQIAQQIWSQGYTQTVVLYPDNDWGLRVVNGFISTYQESGGTVVSHNNFTGKGDYNQVAQQLLSVNLSKSRANRLRRTIGSSFEYDPRRRQDIDAIFLVATPKQARQIKPALNFYFAGDVPVYAISTVNSGKQNRKENKDLNGIQFTELPWLLNDSPFRENVISQWSPPHGQLDRLYGLGADAYHLAPRLFLLTALPDMNMDGVTGTLSINSQQQIQRFSSWAYVHGGVVQQVPQVSSSL